MCSHNKKEFMGKSKHIKDMTNGNITEKMEELLPIRMRMKKITLGKFLLPPLSLMKCWINYQNLFGVIKI